MFHGTSNLILGLYLTSSKFENKELSILGSFYFHEVLEELKTYFFFYEFSLRKGSSFCDTYRAGLNF